MPKRMWKDVEGYEGLYKISNLGDVYSYKSNKKLKPSKDKNYYLRVTLCKNKTKKQYKIHRLVACAFLPNFNNYPQVNHKDENPGNNNVNNLEWCDNKYNSNYGTRNKKVSINHARLSGARHPNAKKVICITTGEIFEYIKQAAEKYGVYKQSISACCKGKLKTAGKDPITGEKLKWKYID